MPHQKEYLTLRCIVCGEIIDPVKVRKAGPRKPPVHCSHDCLAETQRRNGHFSRIGKIGNEVQQHLKAQTGKIPAYEKRRDAVARSNKMQPRRKKYV